MWRAAVAAGRSPMADGAVLDTAIPVCACCRGEGILWVFGGPVVCPYCYGHGETMEANEEPLRVEKEKLL